MSRWHVQRVEVEPLGLDLRTFGDLIAHTDEKLTDPFLQGGEWVTPSPRSDVPWRRDVNSLIDEHSLIALSGQLNITSLKGRTYGGPGYPHSLTRLSPGPRRQCSDLAVGKSERRSIARVSQPHLFEGIEVIGIGNRRQCGIDGGLHLVWLEC
jgi:hypothetical protein